MCLQKDIAVYLPYSGAFLLSHFPHVRLFAAPWTAARQAPLSVEFSRQEYWSGLPCPPPGDLPKPGIEPESLMFLISAGGFFTTSANWEAPAYSRLSLKQEEQSAAQARHKNLRLN